MSRMQYAPTVIKWNPACQSLTKEADHKEYLLCKCKVASYQKEKKNVWQDV